MARRGRKPGSPKPPGSGRKPGLASNSVTRRNSSETIANWLEDGKPVPLQLMLEAMMEEYNDEQNIEDGRRARRAFPYAKEVAAFFHAKPQAAVPLTFPDAESAAAKILEATRRMRESVPNQ